MNLSANILEGAESHKHRAQGSLTASWHVNSNQTGKETEHSENLSIHIMKLKHEPLEKRVLHVACKKL